MPAASRGISHGLVQIQVILLQYHHGRHDLGGGGDQRPLIRRLFIEHRSGVCVH